MEYLLLSAYSWQLCRFTLKPIQMNPFGAWYFLDWYFFEEIPGVFADFQTVYEGTF